MLQNFGLLPICEDHSPAPAPAPPHSRARADPAGDPRRDGGGNLVTAPVLGSKPSTAGVLPAEEEAEEEEEES